MPLGKFTRPEGGGRFSEKIMLKNKNQPLASQVQARMMQSLPPFS